jgi:NAD-dependent deacetylase
MINRIGTMKKIVVISGAGISAESGLNTFRDSGGFWEQYAIDEVATPEAWQRNPELVTEFYNLRRKQLLEAEPNAAHRAIVELEKGFDVRVVTQNVDDLHERAGSSNVLHLHGELLKVRSSVDESLVYEWKKPEVKMGDFCEKGSQLRPHVVWFGEEVPMMGDALRVVMDADVLIVVGTSLNVYPAASLAYAVPESTPIYVVDPGDMSHAGLRAHHIQGLAGEEMPVLVRSLLDQQGG